MPCLTICAWYPKRDSENMKAAVDRPRWLKSRDDIFRPFVILVHLQGSLHFTKDKKTCQQHHSRRQSVLPPCLRRNDLLSSLVAVRRIRICSSREFFLIPSRERASSVQDPRLLLDSGNPPCRTSRIPPGCPRCPRASRASTPSPVAGASSRAVRRAWPCGRR